MFIENTFADTDTITIQASEATPQSSPPSITGSWTSIVPMVLVFVVFYFLLIRPQEKKRKQQEILLLGVKVGEEIMTNSGLFGKVVKINDSDNTIIVQVAKDVEIKMLKNSIVDIISRSKNLTKANEKVSEQKKKSSKKAN